MGKISISALCSLCVLLGLVPIKYTNYQANPPQNPPNDLIAFIRDSNIWIIRPDGSDERQLTTRDNYSEPSISPSGSYIAFIYTENHGGAEIRVLELVSQTERTLVPAEKTPFVLLGNYYAFFSLQWSRDEKYLFFLTADGRAQGYSLGKVEISTGLQTRDIIVSQPREIKISPIGRQVAYKIYYNSPPIGWGLVINDLNGKSPVIIVPVSNGNYIGGFCWSAQADKLFYFKSTLRDQSSPTLVSVSTRDGQSVTIETRIPTDADLVACSPSGSYLLLKQGQTLILLDPTAGSQRVLTTGEQPSWVAGMPQTVVTPYSTCGSWQWTGPYSANDQRIKVTPVTTKPGLPECQGAFELKNNTAFLIFSDYTMGLYIQADAARFIWQPTKNPPDHVNLLSILPLEIRPQPASITQPGTVFIQGNISDTTIAIDMSKFLITAVLAYKYDDDIKCYIPDEQIASLSVEIYEVMTTAADLAISGHIFESMQELKHVAGRFYERAIEALLKSDYKCVADDLSNTLFGTAAAQIGSLSIKPAVLAKLAIDFTTWLGKSLWDLYSFNGLPAKAYLEYQPATASPIPTIDSTPTVGIGESKLIGVWRGQVEGGSAGTTTSEEKIFEIVPNCEENQYCLDVLEAKDFHFNLIPPTNRIQGADACFNLIAPATDTMDAFPFYTACFTLQLDGSVMYEGNGPLWGEEGVLQPMDKYTAEAYKTSINASCQQTLPPKLKNGIPARVAFTDGQPLVLHAYLGTQSQKVGSLPEGSQFSVMSGPICSGGYWWWFISYQGSLVWVAEGDTKVYFIERLP